MIEVQNFLKKSAKIELVYTDKSGKQFSFKTTIKEIYDDKILLSLPLGEIEFTNVEIFERLNVIVCTVSGVLTGNVNLLKKNCGEENDVYVSFPYNNQICQRREDTRTPMHVDFELTVDSQIFALKTKDISGRGLACITSEPLCEFDNAAIILHLSAGVVTTHARKVYSNPVDFNGNVSYINGIAFTDISEFDTNLLVKECLKFQLASKHNERLFETL